jgi:hypothetical protein
MQTWRWMKNLAVAAMLAPLAAAPAFAGDMRTVMGETFWDSDPGPIDPGPYWTSGQFKYDPNGYLERNRFQAEQNRLMTVIGNHSGKSPCVFRKRVMNSDWDFRHAYLRLCRPGANTQKLGG